MADTEITFKIDDHELTVAPGTLVIEAARLKGIGIPSFCYYPGLALQAACRMCLVEVEKAPKLQTACTLVAMNGMVVKTDTPQVHQARKSMLEFLLTNHPLDCPVCDKGGECELQDMTFRYGAEHSRFVEEKQHTPEVKWSNLVYYDAPRCILCFRCVRVCDEGMNVKALGVGQRGVHSVIIPNHEDHLECEECGMCIDICPVGALTSGTYRYHTRPWEMEHVGTICTHCSNGCKTTLGVRNDELLCIKGRYAFDFYKHPERLLAPLARVDGKLEEVSWAKALETVAGRFNEVRARNGKFGVIGSNHTTNEENYYLRKFASKILGTGNIDHHRTGDVVTLLDSLSGKTGKLATTADLYQKKAVLVIGADLALEQPFLSFQIRANWRHHQAHVYVMTAEPVREDKYAAASLRVTPGGEVDAVLSLAERLKAESELVIVFGDAIKGAAVARLVEFGESLGIPVQYICLVDDSNSRGAVDMGLLPDPGGMALPEMLAAEDLDVLWVVGANPLKSGTLPGGRAPMLVVHDLFLTETAQAAEVVFPAASLYEKNGTVTNVCGEVQRLRRAIRAMGTKPDLEIMGLLAREMGVAAELGPWVPETVFEEIRRGVRGYDVPLPVLEAGGAAQTAALNGRLPLDGRPELIRSAHENLFTSGTLGRYSKILSSVVESHGNR